MKKRVQELVTHSSFSAVVSPSPPPHPNLIPCRKIKMDMEFPGTCRCFFVTCVSWLYIFFSFIYLRGILFQFLFSFFDLTFIVVFNLNASLEVQNLPLKVEVSITTATHGYSEHAFLSFCIFDVSLYRSTNTIHSHASQTMFRDPEIGRQVCGYVSLLSVS